MPVAYKTDAYASFPFVSTLPFVRTFITHAGKDIQVFGPDMAT